MPNTTSDSVENMANIRQGLYHGDLIIHWEIKGYQKSSKQKIYNTPYADKGR